MEIYSDIPFWILILWAAFVIGISILFYRKKGWVLELSNLQRYIFIALRSSGLFLIGLLLLGILFQGTKSEVEPPVVITIADNSTSMLNYKDSAQVEKETASFLKHLLYSSSQYQNLVYTLSQPLHQLDSFQFSEEKSDLGGALDRVYNQYYGRNIGAIIILSDGNFNQGISPLIIAEKFKNIPFYTLGVGDTIQKVDQLIPSVEVNQIAFLGNKFPVEVAIEGHMTPKQTAHVQLWGDGKLLVEKKITHQNNAYSLTKVRFLLDAKTVGMHQYMVKITPLENEYNLKNNSTTFFVEVMDNRNKILLVTTTLTPDIGAIKNALQSQNNLELQVVMIDDLPKDLKAYDLVIWHSPGAGNNPSIFQRLKATQKPIWYIVGPKTPISSLQRLYLGAAIDASSSLDENQAEFNQNFTLFKLSDETQRNIASFPPLKSFYGKVKVTNNTAILAYQKVGNVTKSSPLFYFGKHKDLKFAVTYGSGLWRWRIDDYRRNKQHQCFNELIRKTVQYLLIKENKSKLRIHLPSIQLNDEDLKLSAEFYNDSYEPITEPTINLELTAPNEKIFNYAFLPQTKDYTLNLGHLKQGKYKWIATTEYNHKKYTKQGTFAIQKQWIEQQDTRSNHRLLKQLATKNSGAFAPLSQWKEIVESLENRNDITPISYASSIYNKLIDYWWILLLIVALFTIEWGWRKYLGGY